MRMLHALASADTVIQADVEAIRFQASQETLAHFPHQFPDRRLLGTLQLVDAGDVLAGGPSACGHPRPEKRLAMRWRALSRSRSGWSGRRKGQRSTA
jgi:hypothetical protein